MLFITVTLLFLHLVENCKF